MNARKSAAWWRPALLLGAVVVVLALGWAVGLGERIVALREGIRQLGPLGPVAFVLIYAAATVAAVPGVALGVVAGALFGTVLGTVVVSVGATVGAALAFLVARYFARQAVVEWLGRSERFRRLDKITEERGAVIVALTRLVPIFPFNLLNYGFGLTRVPFWTYVFWSWLCMLPGTVLYVTGADAVTRAVSEGRVPWTLVAMVVTVGLFLFAAVRVARRKLQRDGNAP